MGFKKEIKEITMTRYVDTYANCRQAPSGYGMQPLPTMRWPATPSVRPGEYNEGFVDGFCDGAKKIAAASAIVIPVILKMLKK